MLFRTLGARISIVVSSLLFTLNLRTRSLLRLSLSPFAFSASSIHSFCLSRLLQVSSFTSFIFCSEPQFLHTIPFLQVRKVTQKTTNFVTVSAKNNTCGVDFRSFFCA